MQNVIHLNDVATRVHGTWPGAAGLGDERRLQALLSLMDEEPGAAQAGVGPPILLRQLREGASLFREGAIAEAIHFVRAGTFKTFRTAEDGYEQVLGFSGRTEVLGFDAICQGRHPTSAMALEDSSVYTVLLRDLATVMHSEPAFERALHRALSSSLSNNCEMADMMAAVAADVRLARFLLNLSHRMAALGQSPLRFVLRMSRREIGSYLGVAHETVSRSFGTLHRLGLVEAENREVEIVDIEGLLDFSRGTRRTEDSKVREANLQARRVLSDAA